MAEEIYGWKKVNKEEIEENNCNSRFTIGENVYISKKQVTFPIVIKMDIDDYIRRKVVANVKDKKDELFL